MLLPEIEQIFLKLDDPVLNYGFVRGRNCVLNAMQHVNFQYTLSMDLEDFFGSVRPEHVRDYLGEDLIRLCFIDQAPQQGLPTSPLIANIAFSKCDKQIVQALDYYDFDYVYTRYADDIAVSFDDYRKLAFVKRVIAECATRNGFKINPSKTRLQFARDGRRIITGVGVGKFDIYPTRKTLKKIRAAKHQDNANSSRGLSEWAKCKLPKAIYGC